MTRIDELKEQIRVASEAYGNAQPIMSDKEFDQLVNELKTLDPAYIDTVTYDDHTDGFRKAKHDLVTGTLAKCRNEEEFEKWFKAAKNKQFVIESKIDGAGNEMVYKNGVLVQSITRGDGFEGDDITSNVKKIQGVILKLKNDFTGSIRGEVLMRHSIYDSVYKDKMKNCRNAAAGIMKHLDGSETENLNFIAYDIQEKSEEKTIKTEIQKLEFLKDNGFEVPKYAEVGSLEDAFKFRTEQYENRDTLGYDIDGVVVKPAVIDYEDLKNKTPKNSCAIKFELDVAVSEIVNIEWSQSGKYFTPVAIVKPVQLDGTTVQRASCSNINWMLDRGIEIGAKVKIVKKGQIIPYIEGLV